MYSGDGVSVVWQNLTIKADIQKSHLLKKSNHIHKTIIDNASGVVKAGNLVAVLGASGCGKTSLMSALAYRNPSGIIVDGNIKIGGRTIGPFVKHISGYVFQEDLFCPVLTVMEHLNFIAQLKFGNHVNGIALNEKILETLTSLGLYHLRNTVIVASKYGKEKVNLSGGELKRLSIATELLTDPPLLFCDEPTTGLDSYSAYKLIAIMRDMSVRNNKTIICSIHQPNDMVFNMFHQIILLYNGKIVFIGNQDESLSYFKSYGFDFNENKNLAEYFMESLSTDCEKATSMCNDFYKSRYWDSLNIFIMNEKRIRRSKKTFTKDVILHSSWFFKLRVLTRREFVCVLRNPSIELVRIIQNVFLGLIIGLSVNNSITYTQTGMQNMRGIIFSLVTENCFPSMYCMLNYIPHRVPIFYREYVNGTNNVLNFVLSHNLAIIPTFIICPTILTSLIYWFAPLKPSLYAMLLSCFICILVANTAASFGILLSILCKTETLASVVTIPFDYLFTILSGVYVQLRTVPKFLSWIQYVSWIKYGVEALYIVQLKNVRNIECSPNPYLPCEPTGADVLERLDFNPHNLWWDILFLLLLYLLINIASCVFFSIRMMRRNI